MKPKRFLGILALMVIVLMVILATAPLPVSAGENGPGNPGNLGFQEPPERRTVHKWVGGKSPRCIENEIPIHAPANGWEEGPCKPIPTEEPTPVPSPTVVPTTVPTVIPVVPVIDPVLPETLCSDCPCEEEFGRMIELPPVSRIPWLRIFNTTKGYSFTFYIKISTKKPPQ